MRPAVPVIIVVCLALLGAGVGAGVNSVLASFVAPEASDVPNVADGARPSLQPNGSPTVQQNPKLPPPQLRGKTEQQYLDAILCRNVFDPAAIESCKERSSGPVDDGSNSDLPVQLVGTMVATPSTYSVAFITKDDDAAGSYGIDDKLLDATIVGIESERVAVRRGNGKQEYLTMVEGEVSKPPSRKSGGKDDNDDDDVVKLGDNKYQVSRDMIDKYMNDMEALSKMGRALLHRGPDGQFDGYRLSAIRRNTLADKLGIKNGDVIHSVNGKSLNSMSAAMDAYQTLTSENEFSFEVTRRGEKLSLGYDVQ